MLTKGLTFGNYIIYFFTVILLMSAVNSTAQTLTPKEWEAIQKSNNYIIGMGVNANIEEARQTALNDLASKIFTNIKSRFNYVLTNENKGHHVSSESIMKSVINSYTNVTLKNVAEHVVKSKQEYTVFRYMKVSDMETMFKQRINLAKKWANEAIQREKEGKVGDALQYFYWSLALLNSCPDADHETIGYSETSMNQDIHRRVKEILDAITIKATSVEIDSVGQYLTLNVLYHGKPAVNFNYKYFEDGLYSEVFSAKNGKGELLIPPSASLSRLKILAEYECRDEANMHPEIRNVLDLTDPTAFKAAEFFVDTKDYKTIQKEDFSFQEVNTIEETSIIDFHPKKGNLPYGNWSGSITEGKPVGFGTMTFTSSASIRCANGNIISTLAGDKIINAEFDEYGYLYQGTWVKIDGNTKSITP